MAVFVWLPPPGAASSTLGLTENQRGRVVHRGTKGSTAIACPQPIARPKVFDVGEDRVGRAITPSPSLASIITELETSRLL